jgi:hypothetical protein
LLRAGPFDPFGALTLAHGLRALSLAQGERDDPP